MFITAYIRRNGLRYTLRRAVLWAQEHLLRTWNRAYRRMQPSDPELEAMRQNPPAVGLMSILVPVYYPQARLLRALLASIEAQVNPYWEAVLFLGGCRADARAVLDEFTARDPRFRLLEGENGGISRNTNAAAAAARGTWLVFCDHDDLLPPTALWHLADAVARQPDTDVLYTDEDRVTERGQLHTDPYFKPDFQPDTLRSNHYISHLTAVRRSLFEAVGGLDPDFDGSQDHDLLLRLTLRTNRITHAPVIGYHWRRVRSSFSQQGLARCWDAAARAVTRNTSALGFPAQVEVEGGVLRLHYAVPDALHAFVITLYDQKEDAALAQALLARLSAARAGTQTEALPVTDHVLDKIRALWAQSAADVLVLLRVQAGMTLGPGFLTELLMYAQRPDVGAVMPVTLNPSGHIVHAGYDRARDGRLLPRFPGLLLAAGGFHRLAQQSVNVDAVDPACVAIRRGVAPPSDLTQPFITPGLWMVCTPHAQVRLPGHQKAAIRQKKQQSR